MIKFVWAFVYFSIFISTNAFCKTAVKPKEVSFEDFQKFYQLNDAVYSSDSKKIYYIANKNKYPVVWVYDVASQKDELFYDQGFATTHLHMGPTGLYLILQSDVKGNRNEDIFSLRLADKKLTLLSQHKDSQNKLCHFASDKKTVSFLTNFKNNSIFDIYKMVLSEDGQITNEPEALIENAYNNNCGEFSADLTQYVFTRSVSFINSEVVVKDLKNNKLSQISGSHPHSFVGAFWDKTDSAIYSMSNSLTDFKNILTIEKNSQIQKLRTKENWNVVQFIFDREHNQIIYVINEDGYLKVKITDSNFEKVKTLKFPLGIIKLFNLNQAGDHLLYSFETTKDPAELYSFNLKTEVNSKITKLSQMPFKKNELTDAQLVKIKSEDGLEISAWLSQPRQKIKNGIGLIIVHVGPEEQAFPNYYHYRQFLVSLGYTVVIPNFRGSTGYGTRFQKMVYQDWGGGHIKDLVATRKYLISKLGLDSKKISVLGGSFGGFAALSLISQYPSDYCSVVDVNGPMNLFSYITNAPDNMKMPLQDLIGNLEKDKEKIKSISPFFNINKIKTPLMVIQGRLDDRVKIAEADQFVKELKNQKTPVEYLVFDDEGHGLSKNETQIKAFTAAAKFISQNCH